MNELFTESIQIHAADNYALRPAIRGGATCYSLTVSVDGGQDTPRWGGRPRAEIIPKQPFQAVGY